MNSAFTLETLGYQMFSGLWLSLFQIQISMNRLNQSRGIATELQNSFTIASKERTKSFNTNEKPTIAMKK